MKFLLQFQNSHILKRILNGRPQSQFFPTLSTRILNFSVHHSSPVQTTQIPGIMSCNMKPDGVAHNLNFRTCVPTDIEATAKSFETKIRGLYDQTAAATDLSFQSVFQPLLTAQKLGNMCCDMTLPRYVALCPDLRNASLEATKNLKQLDLEMDMRKDVFEKLVAYSDNQAPKDNLSPERIRNLEKMIIDGRRNGLHLSQEEREKVTEIKNQIQTLCLDFSKNLNEDTTTLLWTKEELDGLSANYLEGLEVDTDTGKYKVTLKYPDYLPLMKKCRVPETRQKMEMAFNSRCAVENTALLEKIVKLRHEEANCLGYKSHGAYMQEILMAKNPETVLEFLKSLAVKLQPLWKAEQEVMLKIKKKECEEMGRPFDGKLHMWEMGYYLEKVEEEMYSLDNEEIKKYFPVDVVTNGLLGIYQDLLGLVYTRLDDAQKWDDEVMVYQVNDKKTGELLGYFYMDLYPRDGKYGHACCFPMQNGLLDLTGGVKETTVASIICNFTRATASTPALLGKDEVETYFHEFGHLMHNLCSKTETGRFFGTHVERDFVEAPSQMLENWVWEKEPLRRMSSHYQTKEPMPDDLIEKLQRCRNANAGYTNLRQIVFAMFDQRIHQTSESDVNKVYADTLKEVMGLETTPGTSFPASFGHMCSGYSGQYYSYLWSEVFSMDMFKSVFKKQGIMSPEAGMSYRKEILEKGGSLDATEMLRNFLGRDPNQNAFLESKGLSPSS